MSIRPNISIARPASAKKPATPTRPQSQSVRTSSRTTPQRSPSSRQTDAREGFSFHRQSNSFGSSLQAKLTNISCNNKRRNSPARNIFSYAKAKLNSPFRSAQSRAIAQRGTKPISGNTGSRPNAANHQRTASQQVTKTVQPPAKEHRRTQSTDEKFIPVAKYGHKSCVGFMPGNANKVNQDSFIECPNLRMNPEVFFFAVADGHGFYGREVSTFVKQKLPNYLAAHPDFLTDNKKAITDSVEKVATELTAQEFDVNFSGTTLVNVLMNGKKLWCANTGDSRALMARMMPDQPGEQNPGRHWMSIALSRDQKPDDPGEAERIFKKGGRVEAYQDEEGNPLGPARVWLMDQDIPGLAMSRSLGDLVAASVGVIYEPEILEYEILPEDKFMVIGSDGIFEFLPNEEVVRIVVPFWKTGDMQGACDALVKEAKQTWLQEEEVIDDITCVIVFLNSETI